MKWNSLDGPHQAWNAALALEAVREAGIRLPALVLEQGLRQVKWRGCFQKLRGDRLILDGAHNPEAAMVLAGTWEQAFPGEKAEIIFAAAKDKDALAILEILTPIVAAWHFTAFKSPRAMSPEQLRELLSHFDAPKVPVRCHEDVAFRPSVSGDTATASVWIALPCWRGARVGGGRAGEFSVESSIKKVVSNLE